MTQIPAAATHAPAGHHTVTPYVIVPNARAAIDFYTRAFGAVQTALTTDDSGKVRHAEVRIGDSPVMLAEAFEFGGVSAAHPAALGGRTSLHMYLYVADVDARFAQAIAAGAREVMPVTDQTYGERSGGVVDPFGHVWWISTHLGATKSRTSTQA
jgi:PhnB protein